MLKDESRCEWSLAGDGSILTGSWDDLSGEKPARRARRLGEVGTVVRLLNAMGKELKEARPKIEQDRRERERSEDRELDQTVERVRQNVADYERGAQEAIVDLKRTVAEAERAGETDRAAIYRTLMQTPQLGLQVVAADPQDTEAMASNVRKLQDLSRTVDDQLAQVETAREQGRDKRQRTGWINPLVIGVFGLVAGVIATQVLQEQTEDLGAAVPWIVAVVAWALLDYFVEPKLRLRLANRQLENMQEEVRLAFGAWRNLRQMEARLNRKHLPAWSTMRTHTAGLPKIGDI